MRILLTLSLLLVGCGHVSWRPENLPRMALNLVYGELERRQSEGSDGRIRRLRGTVLEIGPLRLDASGRVRPTRGRRSPATRRP